jgi:hypothetical protein
VPDKGMGVQVPPRTHRDHPLTCESVMGYGFGNVVSGQYLQVRAMGGQVGPRSQNDNGFAARPVGPAVPRPAATASQPWRMPPRRRAWERNPGVHEYQQWLRRAAAGSIRRHDPEAGGCAVRSSTRLDEEAGDLTNTPR